MENEYSARSIFLESVAIDNLMKTRLDKIEQNQRTLKLGTQTNQTDSRS